MVYGTYNELVTGAFVNQQTSILGASHWRCFQCLSVFRCFPMFSKARGGKAHWCAASTLPTAGEPWRRDIMGISQVNHCLARYFWCFIWCYLCVLFLLWISIPDVPWCWNIYLQNWVILVVNVGKYSIHGASGNGKMMENVTVRTTNTMTLGCLRDRMAGKTWEKWWLAWGSEKPHYSMTTSYSLS